MTSGGRLLSKSATFSTRTAAKSELLQRKFPRCIIYSEPIHGLFWELYLQVSREARQPGGESREANVISNWEAPPELRSQSVDSVVRLVIMFGMGCGMVLFLVLCKIVTTNAVSIRLSRRRSRIKRDIRPCENQVAPRELAVEFLSRRMFYAPTDQPPAGPGKWR